MARLVLIALMTSLALATAASAVTLDTYAQVQLVLPAEATLSSWDDQGAPAWSLTGQPGDQVQLSVEIRDDHGAVIAGGPAADIALDHLGAATAALPLPDLGAAGAHDALPVVTLVVCRQ